MTFNDWMNKMLKAFIDKVEKGQYTKEDAEKFKKEPGPYLDYSFLDEHTEEE